MTLPTSFIEDLRGRVTDVSTEPDELARTAKDWSWPAKFAEQEGRPALPAAVVRARSDEDVAATVRLAAAAGVPIVPRGGGSGVMGAAVPHAGRHRDRRQRDGPDRRDRRGGAHRHRRGRPQRPRLRAAAQRARALLPALPRLGRVGLGRRLRRRPRLRRALLALREDRGSPGRAAGRDADRRDHRHRAGAAPRGRPRAHPALRRLGGHARRHHARDGEADQAPRAPAVRGGRRCRRWRAA